MLSEIKALHKELEKTIDGKLPKFVSERIHSLIPKKFRSNSQEQYVFITQVYTSGEYKSVLSLYDKKYESRLHRYGLKEELIFSFRTVKPGLILDHRIRTPRGRFVHTKDIIDPLIGDSNVSNVMLIKRTEWDSHESDDIKESYTIFIYNRNNFIEASRVKSAQDTISKIKKEMSKERIGQTDGECNQIC